MFYDPLIAKLVTFGDTRDQAIANMNDALDAYYIRGVSHNIGFLNALLAHPRFLEGRLTTNFIAEEYPDGFHSSDVPHEEPQILIAVAAAIHRTYMDRAAKLDGQLPSHEKTVGNDFVAIINGDQNPVQVIPVENGYEVSVDANLYRIHSDWRIGVPLVRTEVNSKPMCFQLDRIGLYYRLAHRGSQVDALVMTPQAAELAKQMLVKVPPDMSKLLLSPMPGLLVRLNVSKGDEIKAGEEFAVVEAMKMENSLRATEDVTIAKIFAQQGDTLAVDQPILEFE